MIQKKVYFDQMIAQFKKLQPTKQMRLFLGRLHHRGPCPQEVDLNGHWSGAAGVEETHRKGLGRG